MADQANAAEQKREPYCINKDGSALTNFASIANTAFIHSNQFANIVAATFRQTFADFEGCLFETTKDGRPYISFFFNHAKNENSDLPCACEMANGGATKGNDVISRMRQRDSLMKEGDRYTLTQDGIDIFSPLIPDFYRNRNNKINWNNYVSESNDPTIVPNQWDRSTWGRPHTQFTMVTLVDVNQLAKLIYGSRDKETNEIYDYEVIIRACLDAPMNPYQQYTRNHNYMLEIKQIPVHALQEVYKSIGIVQGSGLITGL